MRNDQRVRGLGALFLTVAYGIRTVVVGASTISVIGYAADPFGLLAVAIVVLALPETIEMLPFGPTRGMPSDPEEPDSKNE